MTTDFEVSVKDLDKNKPVFCGKCQTLLNIENSFAIEVAQTYQVYQCSNCDSTTKFNK